jgi:hypothetical protein
MAEMEQRYMIKSLHARKFEVDEIMAELASAHGEEAYATKVMEYRIPKSSWKDQIWRTK